MKKTIFTIIVFLLGFGFSQKFEIDGNLSVTGSVESTTIDSLKEVIENLKSQVNSLQNIGNLQTRTYALPRIEWVGNSIDTVFLNINDIIGYDLQSGKVDIFSISNYSMSGGDNEKEINFMSKQNINSYPALKNLSTLLVRHDQVIIEFYSPLYILPGRLMFLTWNDSQNSGFIDIVLAITADFPIE